MNDAVPPPLPPDPERLQTLRTYLQLQLAHVEAALAAATHPSAEPGLAEAPYRMESVRLATRHGVLHRSSCFLGRDGIQLNTEDARLAIEDPGTPLSLCETCDPESHLRETRARAEPKNPRNPA